MTADQILASTLETLNGALALDPEAIDRLMSRESSVNEALDQHPTIQTMEGETGQYRGMPVVRPLGLINGILEPLCGARVAAVYDDADGVEAITSFVRYAHPQPEPLFTTV